MGILIFHYKTTYKIDNKLTESFLVINIMTDILTIKSPNVVSKVR